MDLHAAYLNERRISAVFHYVPLHTSPMGQKFGYQHGDLLVTEDLASRLLRLPFFYEITPNEQQRVVEAIRNFFTKTRVHTSTSAVRKD